MTSKQVLKNKTKRGDTLVEAIFAFAIFSMVTVISVVMMNMGIAASERSLELVTARNELNAQAEALRFIHSSYIAEMTLPESCGGGVTACQQYLTLWRDRILPRTAYASEFSAYIDPDYGAGAFPPLASNGKTCDSYYSTSFFQNHAFVLNARQLLTSSSYDNDNFVPYNTSVFAPASLNARLIYVNSSGAGNSVVSEHLNTFTKVSRAEGIWVIGVKGPGAPDYYDFYIQTCWYGAGNDYATALDTIIRLYNPNKATA